MNVARRSCQAGAVDGGEERGEPSFGLVAVGGEVGVAEGFLQSPGFGDDRAAFEQLDEATAVEFAEAFACLQQRCRPR